MQDLSVPKSKYDESLRRKPSVSTMVVLDAFRLMLSAVDFDDDARFEADKIHDVATDRTLASKLQPQGSPAS